MRNIKLLAVVLAALPMMLWATPTQLFTLGGHDMLLKGEFDGVGLNAHAQLSAGEVFEPISDIGARVAWTALSANKVTYVTTSDPDALWQIKNGQATKLADFPIALPKALAASPDGAVYIAGAAPTIYRWAEGKLTEFAEVDAQYIWALQWSPTLNKLLVGTGQSAKLLALDKDGQAQTLQELPQSNITALAELEDGRILMGTASDALIYERSAQGKTRVIYQADAAEIKSFAVVEENIYALGYGSAKPKAPQRARKKSSDKDADEDDAPAMQGCLYEIAPNATVRKLTDLPQIVWVGYQEGEILLGGASKGQFWKLEQNKTATLLGQLPDGGDIVGVLPSGALLSSRPAKLFKRREAKAPVYTSDVITPTQISRWGALELDADAGISVQTRSGFSEKPDEFWGEWKELSNGKIVSAAAPYIQLRLRWHKQSAAFRSATFYYGMLDQAPSITQMRVFPFGFGVDKKPVQKRTPMPLDIIMGLPGNRFPETSEQNKYELLPIEKAGVHSVVWTLDNPQELELEYNVAVRPRGADVWQLLRGKLADPLYMFETNGWPEGFYTARVEAFSPERPDQQIDQKLSEPFVVDNTAPQLSDLKAEIVDGRLLLSVWASDEFLPITRAQVTLNGSQKEILRPADGLWDSLRERVVGNIALYGLEGQSVTISLEVWDQNGNSRLLTHVLKR